MSPNSYVRKFSADSKTIGCYRFDKNIHISKAAIKSIGYREFFFGADGSLEKALSQDEGNWNSTLNRIIESEELPIDGDDYVKLIQCILMLEARSTKMADQFDDWTDKSAKLSWEAGGYQFLHENEQYLTVSNRIQSL